MDALALLCTLHADGPATLKRLRARGYSDLATLIQRSAEELSTDLEVEPAYARRLLREAKHLAVRVGAEGLEAEEAPPVAAASPAGDGDERGDQALAGASMPPSIPISAPAAGEHASRLDDADRSLVERIVGEQAPAEAPDPGPATAPAPEPVHQVEEEAAEEVVEEPVEPGLLTADSLPGLDEELVADLHSSGIRTLSDLAKAESLQLTRALGITFAQARRLGFLARRAAPKSVMDTVRAFAPKARPSTRPAAYTVPVAPIPRGSKPEPAREPAPTAAVMPEVAPQPAAVAEPIVQASQQTPQEASPAPDAEELPSEPTRREPFWAPRRFLADSESDSADQGVKVDPSEIAPRPRFGDRLAQAAAANQERSKPAPPAGPPAGPPPGPPTTGNSGHTVLGWNFEIPRPVEEPALPLGSVAVPTDEARADEAAADERSKEYSAGVSVPRDRATGSIQREQDHGGPFA